MDDPAPIEIVAVFHCFASLPASVPHFWRSAPQPAFSLRNPANHGIRIRPSVPLRLAPSLWRNYAVGSQGVRDEAAAGVRAARRALGGGAAAGTLALQQLPMAALLPP